LPVESGWWVYIVRCRFGTLYTGITRDLDRRLRQHTDGTGAKYLRGRAPLTLVFRQQVPDKSAALVLERQIKQLSRVEKQRLIRAEVTTA
jgi:predicted GIY-YIG superfamily endonuclease